MKSGHHLQDMPTPKRGRLVTAMLGTCSLFALSLAWLIGSSCAGLERVALGEDRVAATVNDVPIPVAAVEAVVDRAAATLELDAAARDRLRAAVLDRLVRQEIAMGALERQGAACTSQQLDLAVSRLAEELKRQGKTLEDYCRDRRLSMPALQRTLRWQLSWDAHLATMLTDQNLQRYFEAHRRDFDGTRLRVAQILFAVASDEENDKPQRQQAEAVRRKIAAGSLSFAAAARQHSQAPSAAAGGEIGWISRHEPMPESFSRAAFQLQQGETSPAIRTPLGIHLIHCLEVQPGTRTWQDAREELLPAAQRDLFDRLVDAAKGNVRVQYSPDYPHRPFDSDEVESKSSDRPESPQSTGK